MWRPRTLLYIPIDFINTVHLVCAKFITQYEINQAQKNCYNQETVKSMHGTAVGISGILFFRKLFILISRKEYPLK